MCAFSKRVRVALEDHQRSCAGWIRCREKRRLYERAVDCDEDRFTAPEIIEHGGNGFLVGDEDEMAALVARTGEIDPHVCRHSAERFAPEMVAAAYEAVYEDACRARVRRLRAVPDTGTVA